MTAAECLERVLLSYRQYYDINTDTPFEPFAAEAAFHSVEKGYFLSKRAVTSESETNEYIFFYTGEHLTAEDIERLCRIAWDEGMSRVEPHRNHRNSDVTVVFLADRIDEEAMRAVKKAYLYKSYKMTFNGWSDFRTVAIETSSGKLSYNRRGSQLKKIYRKVAQN